MMVAKFMLPPRAAEDRSRHYPAFARQGRNVDVSHYRKPDTVRARHAHRRRCRKLANTPLRWYPEFGQEVKLGLILRRTDLDDEQTEAVFGGFQGEGCA